MTKTFCALLGCSFAAATVAAASSPKHSPHQVLVGLRSNAAVKVAATSKKVGRLEGEDMRSKMFVVELRGDLSIAKAESILSKDSNVRFVLPESARHVDKSSYFSVRDYVAYLRDCDEMSGMGEKEAKKDKSADFYAALAYYLSGRVNDAGYVDADAIRAGYAHAALMPKGHIGATSLAPTSGTYGVWSYIGPTNLTIPYNEYYGTPSLSGRISAIAYDPTTAKTIYVGGGNGGVWKSTDGGSTWACISDQSTWQYEAVSSIAVDPKNAKVIYVGTGDYDGFFDGYNQGVMKSSDGGASWVNVTPSITGISDVAVSHISIDPDNDNIVTITTGRGNSLGPNAGNGGLFRSTNAGASWARCAGTPSSDWNTLDISVKSGSARTYWACAAGSPPLLYKSINQGAAWTKVTTLPSNTAESQWTLAASKVSASTLYVLLPAVQKIYKTTTSASSWTDITTATFPNGTMAAGATYNWSQSTYDYYLGTLLAPNAPAGEVLFCGLITTCFSENGGTTWIDYGNTFLSSGPTANMHSDQHQFAVSSTDSSQVLIGNDGGLTKLTSNWAGTNPTVTLTQLNTHLGIDQLYAIAPHPTDTTRILGGAQDNAGPASFGNLNSWANPGSGDGGWCAWDLKFSTPCTIETSDQGSVTQCDLSGNFLATLSQGGLNGAFISPTIVSEDGTKVILGTQDLLVCDLSNTSAGFADEGTDVTGGTDVTALSTCPATGATNYVYSGAQGGQVFLITNPTIAADYKEIDGGLLPAEPVGAVMANPTNKASVLAGFQSLGTGIHHLWQCTNVLATIPVWTSVSGSGSTGLPDVPVNAIVYDPKDPSTTWYVGTDVGVFMTTNSGSTWSNVSTGLPVVQVFDLKAGAGCCMRAPLAGGFGESPWTKLPLKDSPTSTHPRTPWSATWEHMESCRSRPLPPAMGSLSRFIARTAQ